MRQNIYLHFMNMDARRIVGLFDLSPHHHKRLIGHALNAAIMFSEEYTVMPPGFFLECAVAYDVISAKAAFIDAGYIVLPKRELSLDSLIEKKRSEYASVRASFEGLFDDRKVRLLTEGEPLFIPRQTMIGKSATERLEAAPDIDAAWSGLTSQLSMQSIETLRLAPRKLLENGQALTWEALKPHLTPEVFANEGLLRLHLQRNYFTLYIDEFDLRVLTDIPYFTNDFVLQEPSHAYSYRFLNRTLSHLTLEWLLDVDAPSLILLRQDRIFILFMDTVVQLFDRSSSLTDLDFWLGRATEKIEIPKFRHRTQANNIGIGRADVHSLTDLLAVVTDRLLSTHPLARRPETGPKYRPRGKRELARSGDKHAYGRVTGKRPMLKNTIFIGHGRSPVWRELKDFVLKLGLPFVEFNSGLSIAGRTTIDRLEEMLASASFALIIMTAEDETPSGTFNPRLNVVHEIGLFQGRLGFTRAIVLLEKGCEEFSNIHGLTYIGFSKGRISDAFEAIRDVLEREGLL